MEPTTYTQLDIEDSPGELGRVARFLADANVNIERVSADHGSVRIWTKDPKKATSTLTNAGYEARNQEAFEVRLPNRPGELANVCEALGEANVNIESCEGIAQNGSLVFCVDNNKAARKTLERFGTVRQTA